MRLIQIHDRDQDQETAVAVPLALIAAAVAGAVGVVAVGIVVEGATLGGHEEPRLAFAIAAACGLGQDPALGQKGQGTEMAAPGHLTLAYLAPCIRY